MKQAKTQFETDLTRSITINGSDVNYGEYIVILTIRDLTIFTKTGMKPNRIWKVKNVKEYFGLKGNAKALLEQLIEYKRIWIDEYKPNN